MTFCSKRRSNRRAVSCCGLVGLLAFVGGCRQDMQNQPKIIPQRGATLFADGRSVRPQVYGTVARSQGEANTYRLTGMIDGKEGDGLPIPLTASTLLRGQERFNIFCAPCHSRVGNGKGMIVERGYYPATSFHSTRLRDAPLGHFFAVITNGYGAMPNYATELTPEDRWAVVAYIRALQLSQSAELKDIAPGQQAQDLDKTAAAEGFNSGFLDPWMPKVRAAPSPPVLATSVPPPGSPSSAAAVNAPKSAGAGKPPVSSNLAKEGGTSPSTVLAPGSLSIHNATSVPPVNAIPDLASTTHSVSSGKLLYIHKCAVCHQASRAGLPPTIPGLIGIVQKVGEGRIRTVVIEGIPTGKPPMPASTDLSKDDLDFLIAYLKTGN
jgi:mono/diheme cytochrome c family protein